MANHWEKKCLNCGCRKASHVLTYGPGFTGLIKVGACLVRTLVNHKPCDCNGFSDGKLWENGQRILPTTLNGATR